MSLVFVVTNLKLNCRMLTCATMLSIIIRAGPRGVYSGASQVKGLNRAGGTSSRMFEPSGAGRGGREGAQWQGTKIFQYCTRPAG